MLWYRSDVSGDRPGSNKGLPPPLEGFGKDDGRRAAAAAKFSKQVGSTGFDKFDDSVPPPPPKQQHNEVTTPAPSSAPPPVSAARPNLEPVSDNAHPPQNRRMPTQPPSSLVLDLGPDDSGPHRRDPEPADEQALPQLDSADAEARPPPPPPTLAPRHSPAPVRRGLFSGDRITNVLAGVALGLLVMIFPAKKFARSYEVREIEPLLTELEGAIEHPLGVEAGLVESPEKIASRINDGRDKVRKRFMMIWLLIGIPIGLGLGFAPRPGE